MTVANSSRRVIGVANGVTVVWPYAFLIPLASEISVVYTNPNRDAIDPTGTGVVLNPATYTVTGIGNPAGGAVTYPLAGPAAAAPVTITIVRTIPYTQPSTMQNQGSNYPQTYEAALDNVEMQVQQVAEIFTRTPSFPIGYNVAAAGVSLILPTPTPGALIGWDPTGKFLTNLLSASALIIAPLVVGQIPFGAAGNTLTQDGNLFWDNANKRLGIGNTAPGVRVEIGAGGAGNANELVLISGSSAAGFGPALRFSRNGVLKAQVGTQSQILGDNSDNLYILPASGTAVVQGTLNATTNVAAPYFQATGVVSAVGTMSFESNFLVLQGGTAGFQIRDSGDANTNVQVTDAGAATFRASVITPIVDSGTTGSLLLKTNNGTTGFRVDHNGSGVAFIAVTPGVTGDTAKLRSTGEINTGLEIQTSGTGSVAFRTNGGNDTQLAVLATASATRGVTITGSNGGNPTISTTAGSLAITPSVVIAGVSLSVGTNPGTAGAINIPYNTGGLLARNSTNNGDVPIIEIFTRNSIANVVVVAQGSAGALVQGRSGGAAPTTSDLFVGQFTVWRDTGGATTKLYYNNAGTIQSVALA